MEKPKQCWENNRVREWVEQVVQCPKTQSHSVVQLELQFGGAAETEVAWSSIVAYDHLTLS